MLAWAESLLNQAWNRFVETQNLFMLQWLKVIKYEHRKSLLHYSPARNIDIHYSLPRSNDLNYRQCNSSGLCHTLSIHRPLLYWPRLCHSTTGYFCRSRQNSAECGLWEIRTHIPKNKWSIMGRVHCDITRKPRTERYLAVEREGGLVVQEVGPRALWVIYTHIQWNLGIGDIQRTAKNCPEL